MVVTGCGVVSPVGIGRAKAWDSLTSGKSGVKKITQFDASLFDSQIAGEVRDFDPADYFDVKEIRRTPRFVQFALVSAQEALEDSGLDLNKVNLDRCGVIIGSGIGDLKSIETQYEVFLKRGPSRFSPFMIPMLITNEAAGHVAIKFGFRGVNFCTVTACASGNHAIGEAFREIKYGDADIMLTGGTEACITRLGVGGFCALKALSRHNNEPEKASRPFDLNRDGFIMSEGAAILVLEEFEHAKRRGAQIYAEICGRGVTCDAYHITAPAPDGKVASRTMELAMEEAGVNKEDISYINAHGTSTKLNDKTETMAIKRLFGGLAKSIPVSSTKSMTGHLLGAAGAFESYICCMAIKHGVIPPTINYETPDPDCDLDYVPNTARRKKIKTVLNNSLGFGGHNISLLYKKISS